MKIINYFKRIIENYQTKKEIKELHKENEIYSDKYKLNSLENQSNNNSEEGMFTWHD
jgi:hypothetical protein